MATIIKGVVTNGVVVPRSPLPEGAWVDIHVLENNNPLLQFSGHLDPNDPLEREFGKELARRRQEDTEKTEDGRECPNSSSTPTT
jgi:hypothetical protein